jgi:hypothetical protein
MKWIQNYFMAFSCPMNILGFSYDASFMVSFYQFIGFSYTFHEHFIRMSSSSIYRLITTLCSRWGRGGGRVTDVGGGSIILFSNLRLPQFHAICENYIGR